MHAPWECGFDPVTSLGISNCTASVVNGGAINTKPGKHRFTVGGIVSTNGRYTVNATVIYTVR